MKVDQALKTRYCCRGYKTEAVNKDTILAILELAAHTPSWANTQPWEVFVASGEPLERLRSGFLTNFANKVAPNPDLPSVTSWPPALEQRYREQAIRRFSILGIERDDKEKRRENTLKNFRFFGAPAVIYLCMDKTQNQWGLFDMGMFAQSIMLAARQYGLDTAPAVMLTAYPDLIRSEMEVPENLAIAIGIAIGFEDAEDPQNIPRTPRREMLEFTKLKGF